MLQSLNMMDLTGFSDLSGSVPVWTVNVLVHARRFDETVFFVTHVWQTTLSVLHIHNAKNPDECCISQWSKAEFLIT